MPVLADVPLERLHGAHVAEMFTRIERLNAELTAKQGGSRSFVRLDGGVRTRPRHVGIASQHRVYAALREFCNFEVRKTRRLAFNPVYAVELEPEVTPETTRWSARQAYAFLASTKDDPLGPLFRIVLLRGARRGEAVGLRWADADLDAAYVRVRRPIVLPRGAVTESRPKTKTGDRLIWLDAETVRIPKEYRTAQLKARLMAPAWRVTPLLTLRSGAPDARPRRRVHDRALHAHRGRGAQGRRRVGREARGSPVIVSTRSHNVPILAENGRHHPLAGSAQVAPHRALVLVAEADGNRTRQRRGTPLTGFEDQGDHQEPRRLRARLYSRLAGADGRRRYVVPDFVVGKDAGEHVGDDRGADQQDGR